MSLSGFLVAGKLLNVTLESEYPLIRRLILYARDDIETNLCNWPKGEIRRMTIIPGDSHPEIQNVLMVLRVLNKICAKYDVPDKRESYSNLIDVIINCDGFLFVFETISNCFYKFLVFEAITLANYLLSDHSRPDRLDLLFKLFIGETEHHINEAGVFFITSIYDRIYLAMYIRGVRSFYYDFLSNECHNFLTSGNKSADINWPDMWGKVAALRPDENITLSAFDSSTESMTRIPDCLKLINNLCCGGSYRRFQDMMHNVTSYICPNMPSILILLTDTLSNFIPTWMHIFPLTDYQVRLVLLLIKTIKVAVMDSNTTNQLSLINTSIVRTLSFAFEYYSAISAENIPDFPFTVNISAFTNDLTDFSKEFKDSQSLRVCTLNLIYHVLEGQESNAITEQLLPLLSLPSLSRRLIYLHKINNCAAHTAHWSKEKMQKAESWLNREGFELLRVFCIAAVNRPQVMEYIQPFKLSVLNRMLKDKKEREKVKEDSKNDRRHALDQYFKQLRYQKVFEKSFMSRLKSVEIVWDKKGIMKLFFALPDESKFISEDIIEDIKRKLDVINSTRGEVESADILLLMLRDDFVRQVLNGTFQGTHRILKYFLKFQDYLDYSILLLAILINSLLVLTLVFNQDDVHNDDTLLTGRNPSISFKSAGFEYSVQVLTILQFLLTGFRLFQGLILRSPIVYENVITLERNRTESVQYKKDSSAFSNLRVYFMQFLPLVALFVALVLLAVVVYARYSHIVSLAHI